MSTSPNGPSTRPNQSHPIRPVRPTKGRHRRNTTRSSATKLRQYLYPVPAQGRHLSHRLSPTLSPKNHTTTSQKPQGGNQTYPRDRHSASVHHRPKTTTGGNIRREERSITSQRQTLKTSRPGTTVHPRKRKQVRQDVKAERP